MTENRGFFFFLGGTTTDPATGGRMKRYSSANPKPGAHNMIEAPVSSIELPPPRRIDMFSKCPQLSVAIRFLF